MRYNSYLASTEGRPAEFQQHLITKQTSIVTSPHASFSGPQVSSSEYWLHAQCLFLTAKMVSVSRVTLYSTAPLTRHLDRSDTAQYLPRGSSMHFDKPSAFNEIWILKKKSCNRWILIENMHAQVAVQKCANTWDIPWIYLWNASEPELWTGGFLQRAVKQELRD